MALRADDVDLGRDRDLVERYQAGDAQAFDDLYRRYFGRLQRYCQRHARDSHEAEEIAQEAFVKAFRSMHTLRGERRFYPWMTVIAKRISIDRHRKLSRLELTDEPDVGSVDPDLDHLFDEVDRNHLRDAMDRLGPRHREVLRLREGQGMSYADIAAHLGVPVTTVEALLHRARKALRREFRAVGGEGRGLWALAPFGWIAARSEQLRGALSRRWAEAVAVAAPVAVGAVTAAVVLSPASPPPGTPDAGPARADDPALTDGVNEPTPPSASVEVAAPPDAEPPAAVGSAPTAAPSIEAGPVDVFVGPDGTDRARAEAERMPLHGTGGPATAGVDPQTTADHVAEFVDGAVATLLAPARTSADPDPSPAPLPGGSR